MPKESKPVVLVADDEPSTVAMLSSHLRTKGYTVLEASDGDQAWELAHENLPDLVLLDVMMPGMSGWEVCRKIREAVSLAHTGVIMLTGIGENLNEMTSPLYGADAYLDKPFEFTDLDEKISETIARRSAGALGRPDSEAEDRDDDADDADLVKETLRAVTARKPAKAKAEKAEAKPKATPTPNKPTAAKSAESNGPKPALAKAVVRPAPKAEKPEAPKARPAPKSKKAPVRKAALTPATSKPTKVNVKTASAKAAKPPAKAKAKAAKVAAKAKAPAVSPSKAKKAPAKAKARPKAAPPKAAPKAKAKAKPKAAPPKAARAKAAKKGASKKAPPAVKAKKAAAKPAKKAAKKR